MHSNHQITIFPYQDQYRFDLANALSSLQTFECSLSDTRKPSEFSAALEYLNDLLKNGFILIATCNEDFAGFIAYYEVFNHIVFEKNDSNHHFLISDVFVLQEYRGKKVSKMLFDACLEDLKVRNFSGRVRICSLANNIIACNSYEKYGFQPYEITYEIKI